MDVCLFSLFLKVHLSLVNLFLNFLNALALLFSNFFQNDIELAHLICINSSTLSNRFIGVKHLSFDAKFALNTAHNLRHLGRTTNKENFAYITLREALLFSFLKHFTSKVNSTSEKVFSKLIKFFTSQLNTNTFTHVVDSNRSFFLCTQQLLSTFCSKAEFLESFCILKDAIGCSGFRLILFCEVHKNTVVPVLTAQVVVTTCTNDTNLTRLDVNHSNIKRSTTKVINQNGLVLAIVSYTVCNSCSSRLVDNCHNI